MQNKTLSILCKSIGKNIGNFENVCTTGKLSKPWWQEAAEIALLWSLVSLATMAKEQVCIVMRHGRRHDSDNRQWVHQAAHPWDTPLSTRGVAEVEDIALALEPLQPEVVVVSPFLRCMQTANRVIRQWGRRPEGVRVIVDRQVAEVFNPALLHAVDPGCIPTIKRWYWQWHWQERAKQLLGSIPGCQLEFSNRPWPGYPESKDSGKRRFSAALEHWTSQTKGNVLVITHGDAVLSGARKADPRCALQGVQPGGFVVMSRSISPICGPWKADEDLIKWHGVEFKQSYYSDLTGQPVGLGP